MTYEIAMGYMKEIQKRGSILGLNPVRSLLNRLHNPQNALSVIHVAGTNGKGSICACLEQMYISEQKRVGRYLSPTLHCYLERFQINGEYMTEEEFAFLFSKVYPLVEEMRNNGEEIPTAFEIETVIAFLYFLQKKVDVVILETGMGGREDATNVVDCPIATVFASIGMDHMQFLGDTIEKITYEKAGIMKKKSPAVCYPNAANVNDVLKKAYIEVNQGVFCDAYSNQMLHNLNFVDKKDIHILEEDLQGSRFLYKGEEYAVSLAGRYQIYNASTAIQAKLVIDGHLNKEALTKVKWEGRFEQIDTDPLFMKDGAHNLDGAKALKESIQKHFTNRELIFIIGVLRDKEYSKMMACLCPLAKKVYTITAPGERGLSAGDLAEAVRPYCKDVNVCQSVEEAVCKARKTAVSDRENGQDPVIIAWGSLSYIGQIE